MNQFDSNLTKSLEDFMESYKMVDVEQIYSNGTEFVPIFRVKQWLEYNNINNLQSKIDKAIDKLESLLPMCIMPNNMLIHGTEKTKIIEETLDILKEGE